MTGCKPHSGCKTSFFLSYSSHLSLCHRALEQLAEPQPQAIMINSNLLAPTPQVSTAGLSFTGQEAFYGSRGASAASVHDTLVNSLGELLY